MRLKSLLSIIGLLLMPVFVFGFTFSVVPTTETCPGNATLTFIPANVNPGGSIEYIVYKLPETIIPYATTTAPVLGGLTAGTYKVVAVETIGAGTTQQEIEVVIAATIVPLEFTVESLNQACATVSNIRVNLTSGTAISFEIFEGPLTFPSQTSNVFNNLPVGVYKIRVFDDCGAGVVSTFTVTLNPAGLTIGSPAFSNTVPPVCNSTIATQAIIPSPGTVIAYPLSVQYTVHPPNGDPPIRINQIIASGSSQSQEINATLPSYLNQDYTYDLLITDACNTSVSGSFTSSQDIGLRANVFILVCDDNYFELNATHFIPPYSLNFTSFPPGFNPMTYNMAYPGPYTLETVTFGSQVLTVPLGSYSVSISDSCGKSTDITFTISSIPAIPSVIASHNGCLSNSGKIAINIPHYKLSTAVIISAPSAYPFPLPSDISSFIDGATGALTLPSVPLGDYVIALTDFCNSAIVPVTVSIPAYIDQGLVYDIRPGCELGKSSISIASGNNAKLTALHVDLAPAGFPFPVPFAGTDYITASGSFYMNNLPPGNYTFTGTDECGYRNTKNVTLNGYSITSDDFLLQTNCGTFDLALDFISNGTANETYWLQKQIDAASNIWGHPLTDVAVGENNMPNATNSFAISNHATNYNLAFNGTFRIVRSFSSYNNGKDFNAAMVTTMDKTCIEVLQPLLEFDESLEIIDAHRMPCSTDSSLDVIVDVNGALPLHYTITEKDGVAFSLDNGTSNVFHDLPAGVYTFQVQDNCGNIVNRIFDVGALGSLINLTKPDDQLRCVDNITNNEVFDLTEFNNGILGTQSSTEYTLQYFASENDAQLGINPILNVINYNPANNPQTVFAKVYFNQLPNCYELVSFGLYVGQTPKLSLNTSYLACNGGPITVSAAANNLPATAYEWSDGSSGDSVTVTQSGVTKLTVTATNTYGTNLSCSATKEIEVVISVPPTIDRIETIDWTDNENSITVISEAPDLFEYSLNHTDFQPGNVFPYLETGVYDVYIRDIFGCGEIHKEVWLLNYPRFFTPNGDGYHDRWFIENAENEPDFKVYIFDRYGKLLYSFGSKDAGWDGIYNGREIFSDDYWFVIYRQDGRVHKGHFTLKR